MHKQKKPHADRSAREGLVLSRKQRKVDKRLVLRMDTGVKARKCESMHDKSFHGSRILYIQCRVREGCGIPTGWPGTRIHLGDKWILCAILCKEERFVKIQLCDEKCGGRTVGRDNFRMRMPLNSWKWVVRLFLDGKMRLRFVRGGESEMF